MSILEHYTHSENEAIASLARQGLRRLLLGEEADQLDIDKPDDASFIREIDSFLKLHFCDQLNANYAVTEKSTGHGFAVGRSGHLKLL